MKMDVVTCDRCDARIEGKPAVLTLKTGSRGHPLAARDLCPACEDTIVLTVKTRGHAKEIANGHNTRVDLLERQLQQVRGLAADGIEMWANGATLDQLAQVLRDVSSNARRG